VNSVFLLFVLLFLLSIYPLTSTLPLIRTAQLLSYKKTCRQLFTPMKRSRCILTLFKWGNGDPYKIQDPLSPALLPPALHAGA